IDHRPKFADIGGWLRLRRQLRGAGFTRVYDLHTSDRSSFYRALFWPGPFPEWVGIARGASHPHTNPHRDFMHTIERQTEQLALAGLPPPPLPDLKGVAGPIGHFALPHPFALLVPGGAAHRPGKRWPASHYQALARWLLAERITPVLVGGPPEHALISGIMAATPGAIDLAQRTSLIELVGLSEHAVLAIGNDTGVMHIAAATGTPSIVLFSHESDPARCAPRGDLVEILRRPRLADLAPEEVIACAEALLKRA
ncbi:MAG TPA: glycosyltransferase family 9 protein, partial [Stellaceae bacterium]|nr:glycosyltransferase family 9 protein [Stellaceae bacterium]